MLRMFQNVLYCIVVFYDKERFSLNYLVKVEMYYIVVKRQDWFLFRLRRLLFLYVFFSRIFFDIRNVY